MVRAWLTWWVVLAALYLWLADNTVWPELAVGAVAAAIGATGTVLVRRHRLTRMRWEARWLRGAWRPLLGVATDFGPLVRALVRRREGVFVEVPLPGPVDEPGYRATVEALGSLAPNSIVVDIDHERGVALVHQLLPREVRL
jgi:hypothetical protein